MNGIADLMTRARWLLAMLATMAAMGFVAFSSQAGPQEGGVGANCTVGPWQSCMKATTDQLAALGEKCAKPEQCFPPSPHNGEGFAPGVVPAATLKGLTAVFNSNPGLYCNFQCTAKGKLNASCSNDCVRLYMPK